MPKILINDVTLRDGNHAIAHKMTVDQISAYVAADAAEFPSLKWDMGMALVHHLCKLVKVQLMTKLCQNCQRQCYYIPN